MTDYTQKDDNLQPSKKTIDFVKKFARVYRTIQFVDEQKTFSMPC